MMWREKLHLGLRRLEGDKKACTPALKTVTTRMQRHLLKKCATIFEDTHECTRREEVDKCD
jgi:hypothetical protein